MPPSIHGEPFFLRLRRAASDAVASVTEAAIDGASPAAAESGGTLDGGSTVKNETVPAPPNVMDKMKDALVHQLEKLPIPMWAIIMIGVVALLLLLCCCICICKKCCKKRGKWKDKGKKGGVDLKVQPDLDELEVNMEDNEDAKSQESEVKLGKLQFSLDYQFEKGELTVGVIQAADLPGMDMSGTSNHMLKFI